MSFAGNPFKQQTQDSKPNFDHTSGGAGNRDAWNNPIRDDRTDKTGDTTGTDGKKTNASGDNAGVDDDVIANIWDKVENKDNKDNNQQQQTQQVQQQQVDPAAQMQQYLSKVGLTGIELTTEEKEAATNGDFGPMLAKLNQQIVNAHVKGLSGSKELIDKAVKDAVATVRDQAVSHYMGQHNITELNRALPWTKEKSIAPVAASVMQKFLDRGWDTERAVKGVKDYFDHINSKMNGGNTNRSTNFSSGNSEQEKENNWLSVLSPSR